MMDAYLKSVVERARVLPPFQGGGYLRTSALRACVGCGRVGHTEVTSLLREKIIKRGRIKVTLGEGSYELCERCRG